MKYDQIKANIRKHRIFARNLDEGEFLCYSCKGWRIEPGFELMSCYVCDGAGKVDWIENILRRKIPFFINTDDYKLQKGIIHEKVK